MVTRQETARPLLTPGEVMQLPSDDELVLISGCHPIRAKKARYYEDRQLQSRIVPAPAPPHGADTGGEADPLSRRGDPQDAAQDPRVLQRRTRTLARQVALDPGDDMSL